MTLLYVNQYESECTLIVFVFKSSVLVRSLGFFVKKVVVYTKSCIYFVQCTLYKFQNASSKKLYCAKTSTA